MSANNSIWTNGNCGFLSDDISTDALECVKSASTFPSHLLFINNDNSLWGAGENYTGQLGIKTDANSDNSYSIPVNIINNAEMAEAGDEHSII